MNCFSFLIENYALANETNTQLKKMYIKKCCQA